VRTQRSDRRRRQGHDPVTRLGLRRPELCAVAQRRQLPGYPHDTQSLHQHAKPLPGWKPNDRRRSAAQATATSNSMPVTSRIPDRQRTRNARTPNRPVKPTQRIPEILRRATQHRAGWTRLGRFATAMTYPPSPKPPTASASTSPHSSSNLPASNTTSANPCSTPPHPMAVRNDPPASAPTSCAPTLTITPAGQSTNPLRRRRQATLPSRRPACPATCSARSGDSEAAGLGWNDSPSPRPTRASPTRHHARHPANHPARTAPAPRNPHRYRALPPGHRTRRSTPPHPPRREAPQYRRSPEPCGTTRTRTYNDVGSR
jgi:hypothetical protein